MDTESSEEQKRKKEMSEIQSMSVDGETQRGNLAWLNTTLVNIDGEYSDGLSVELVPLLFAIIFRIKARARVHSAALTQTWSIPRLLCADLFLFTENHLEGVTSDCQILKWFSRLPEFLFYF